MLLCATHSSSDEDRHRLYAIIDTGDEYLHGNRPSDWNLDGTNWPLTDACASMAGGDLDHYERKYAARQNAQPDSPASWSTDGAGVAARYQPTCRLERAPEPLKPTRPAPLPPNKMPVLDFNKLDDPPPAPNDSESVESAYKILSQKYLEATMAGEMYPSITMGRPMMIVSGAAFVGVRNSVIVGDNNNIHGDNNLVVGDNNAVHGDNNTSRGDRNKLFGACCTNYDMGNKGIVRGGNSTRISARGAHTNSLSARSELVVNHQNKLPRQASASTNSIPRWTLSSSSDDTDENVPADPPPSNKALLPITLTNSEIEMTRQLSKRRRRKRKKKSSGAEKK